MPDIEAVTGQTANEVIDTPQTSIRFGGPGIERKDDDFVPAYVMNHILGGGSFSSWLFEEVREKRGLAYSVYSYVYYTNYHHYTQNCNSKDIISVL